MPNTRYYNLTEASKFLNIRQLKLYSYISAIDIKAVPLANMQGLFLTSEDVQFIQTYRKGEKLGNG